MFRALWLLAAATLVWPAAAAEADIWLSPMIGAALSDGDSAASLALGLGRTLTPAWSVELGARHSDAGDAARHGSIGVHALWFPWSQAAMSRPYVTAGLGAARFEDGGTTHEGLDAQAGAGILQSLGSRWDLRLDLRYAHAGDGGDAQLATWIGQLGLRYRLGAGGRLPAAAADRPVQIVRPMAGAPPALDRDGDSVLDRDDRCPDTGDGATVGIDGCPIDPDGDGIPTRYDGCPDTPASARVGIDGCALALADADGDGVADPEDDCADTLPAFAVDARGCAPAPQRAVLKGVHFELDSERLAASAGAALDRIAAALRGQPANQAEVEGHSCALGPEHHNLALSRGRAEAVRAALIARGVPASQLRAEGYGEYRPVADNATEAGRQRNRRVELRLLAPRQ